MTESEKRLRSRVFIFWAQDETVYEYDCEGKPTAGLPEDNPVKMALREIVDKLVL